MTVPTNKEIHEAYLKWVHAFQVESMSREDAFAAGFRFGVIKRDVELEQRLKGAATLTDWWPTKDKG